MSADASTQAAMRGWEELDRKTTEPEFFVFAEGYRQGWKGGMERWPILLASDWPEAAEAARLELLGALKRIGKDATITIVDTHPAKEAMTNG